MDIVSNKFIKCKAVWDHGLVRTINDKAVRKGGRHIPAAQQQVVHNRSNETESFFGSKRGKG